MALELTVNNNDEFEDLINNQDREVSGALVETILKNLKGRKRHLHVFSVAVIEDGSIYDITIDRKDFEETLTNQLPILEKYEMYEVCSEVVKALEYLKEKKK
jgi:cytidylate kinase